MVMKGLELLDGPWVESDCFSELLGERDLSPYDRLLAERYHADGFVIVDQSDIVSDLDIANMWEEIADLCAKGHVIGDVNRAQDAWRSCRSVYEIATHPEILRILRMLYGREPRPFQTLNFLHGTEQETHSDTIHFSAKPSRYMCGVWMALEDITLAQGPLHYYTGSHKLPELDYEDLGIPPVKGDQSWSNPNTRSRYSEYETKIAAIARDAGFPRCELAIKKGSYLIWASNLLHGGNPRENSLLTRKSQVTHYYFDDTIRFTPMFSRKSRGLYSARFINDITNGEPLPDRLSDTPVVWLPKQQWHTYFPIDPNESRILSQQYLERYPDVRSSSYGTDDLAFAHFSRHGAIENRKLFSFGTRAFAGHWQSRFLRKASQLTQVFRRE